MKNKERREVTLQEACIVTKQNTAAVTETEMVPIENACGRIAAEDVSADFDQPSFDRSPLDGFAVRSADIAGASPESPAELSVIDEVCAGEISSITCFLLPEDFFFPHRTRTGGADYDRSADPFGRGLRRKAGRHGVCRR